jgi:hypothetical protein
MSQQRQDLNEEPNSPEDALLHIARNTAENAKRLEVIAQQNEQIKKSLGSISISTAVLAIIAVMAVILSFYTWQYLQSLADTARLNEIIRSQ